MAISLVLASFPNSRIKPRNAASTSATTQVDCVTVATTLVAAANPNRVYLTLRNSENEDIYYGYHPLVNASDGFLIKALESFDIFYLGAVYVFVPGLNNITVDIDEGSG